MEKKKLTETDVRTKFITPALLDAGWDLHTQIREEVALTSGRILVKGQKHKRGPAKYADYILILQAQHPHRSHRGQGQQPQYGCRDAAGT
jgi:type I restriction enzyme R subunit